MEEKGEVSFLPAIQVGVKISNKVKKKRPARKHVKPKYMKKLSSFELQYSKLGESLIPEKKTIDYVLVHPEVQTKEQEECRQKFESKLLKEGFLIDKEVYAGKVFKLLSCPFKRLCMEAEKVKLQLPLSQGEIVKPNINKCCEKFIEKYFVTDDEVDFVSAPFVMEKIHWFHCYEDPSQFFRPSLRSLLTHLILISTEYRDEKERSEEGDLQGLLYLLREEVYTDSFVLHNDIDEAEQKTAESVKSSEEKNSSSDSKSETYGDSRYSRRVISNAWLIFWKFQPLWKIRNYFGEKIAFYFAWTGMLLTSLWIPTIFGIVIFCYGLNLSYDVMNEGSNYNSSTSAIDSLKRTVSDVLSVIQESFDNDITPYFALIICLWGTIFTEVWKRKSAELSHQWDVANYETLEPNRPEFHGSKQYEDPISHQKLRYYPIWNRIIKFFFSGSVVIFMVCLVATSVMGVIVYRVIISINYCSNLTEMNCFMLTTIVSSILNAISILLLGIAYTRLAYRLTSWENHRTQSSFDDALVIKLFAFHFVNSYASCFYIAFLRGQTLQDGILGMGTSYQDECDGSCMSQLSFQVLILMITKPFPKLLKDVLLPKILQLWRVLMRRRYFGSKVEQETEETSSTIQSKRLWIGSNIHEELNKPKLKDFTLEEYTEKMIQYGYLMMFAASFPLAPLIALITNMCDIRVDANRLLWTYRRPVAFISQDIGMWSSILKFLNVAGVISNAFLIAFTSRWSEKFTLVHKLWIVIGFEHVVFAVKLFIEFFIPDIPAYVKLSIRQNKFKIADRLKHETKDYRNIIPEDSPVTWFDSNGQLKTFKEPILEEPPEKRNSCAVEENNSAPLDLAQSGLPLSGGGKQHRMKRKSMHAVEMPTKQKKGSVADDEDEGLESDGVCTIFRDRMVNRNRPHSLAAAGSTSLSLGSHPENIL